MKDNSVTNSAEAGIYIGGGYNNDVSGNVINEAPIGIFAAPRCRKSKVSGNKFFNTE